VPGAGRLVSRAARSNVAPGRPTRDTRRSNSTRSRAGASPGRATVGPGPARPEPAPGGRPGEPAASRASGGTAAGLPGALTSRCAGAPGRLRSTARPGRAAAVPPWSNRGPGPPAGGSAPLAGAGPREARPSRAADGPGAAAARAPGHARDGARVGLSRPMVEPGRLATPPAATPAARPAARLPGPARSATVRGRDVSSCEACAERRGIGAPGVVVSMAREQGNRDASDATRVNSRGYARRRGAPARSDGQRRRNRCIRDGARWSGPRRAPSRSRARSGLAPGACRAQAPAPRDRSSSRGAVARRAGRGPDAPEFARHPRPRAPGWREFW
jgi:hypothetical protein